MGFLLAAIGSAIGLGNVWRFPYITGQYGGGAFVLVYIGCVFAVGIPIMLAEFLLGRKTQRNCVGAFKILRPGSPWVITGWLGVVSGFVILSFYGVVGGWVLHYTLLSIRNGFMGLTPEEVSSMFAALAASPTKQIIGHTLFALQTEGAKAGIQFLLHPRWDQMSPTGILEALGQAFFSLSLGMGAMITYGSYLKQETNLVRSAVYVAMGDTLVAILAGFVIFPLVFTFHLEPGGGPGLIFQTLPIAFSQLPAGVIVGSAFFILLAFAALTSAISLLEVVVAYFIDERGWNRRGTAWLMGTIIFACGVPSAIWKNVFGMMDQLATNFLLPIGAFLIALFVGWVLTQRERLDEFEPNEIRTFAYQGWSFLLRFVSPVAVAVIFLHLLRKLVGS
jgi:NSS family neurotransmitter:Na+ symporter